MDRFVGSLSTDVYGVTADEARVAKVSISAVQAATAGEVAAAFATSATVTTVVTADITNPPCPRNLVITPGGVTADVKAGNVTVTGTNINDEVITEVFAFLENATAATVGAKAFKTVTSISAPSQDGAGATYRVDTGDKLGMPYMMDKKTLVMSVFNGTIETTAAAQVVDADEIEKNTVDLSSVLNGSAVELYFIL